NEGADAGFFDVVIGNPPWGSNLTTEDKVKLKEYYPEIDSSTPNSYAYFCGCAFKLSKDMMTFILPDSILLKDFRKTRNLMKENLQEISWFLNTGIPDDFKTFVYVEHDVCILILNKSKTPLHCHIKKHQYNSIL